MPAPAGSILVLSAFDPELAPLRAAQKRGDLPRSVWCTPAGIGAIDAAVGACTAITALGPAGVLFIGTAGSYGDTVPLGGVAIARKVTLASTAVARGDGYVPAPMTMRGTTDAALRQGLFRSGPRATTFVADVAAPLAITKRAALGARLATATGATVENLEVFAVARAAALLDVPFCAVLGIANRVGPRAHAEWLAHQAGATQAASAVILEFLRGRTRTTTSRQKP